MVNFNNETIMSRPPSDVVALILLEKYANVLEALELYIENESKDFTHNSFIILKSRLFVLFYSQKQAFRRALKKEDFYRLENIKNIESFEELRVVYDIIMTWLDSTQILKLDRLQALDLSDIESDNQDAGFN